MSGSNMNDPIERARARVRSIPGVDDLLSASDAEVFAETIAAMEGLCSLLADNDGDAAAAYIGELDRPELELLCLTTVSALEGARRAYHDK